MSELNIGELMAEMEKLAKSFHRFKDQLTRKDRPKSSPVITYTKKDDPGVYEFLEEDLVERGHKPPANVEEALERRLQEVPPPISMPYTELPEAGDPEGKTDPFDWSAEGMDFGGGGGGGSKKERSERSERSEKKVEKLPAPKKKTLEEMKAEKEERELMEQLLREEKSGHAEKLMSEHEEAMKDPDIKRRWDESHNKPVIKLREPVDIERKPAHESRAETSFRQRLIRLANIIRKAQEISEEDLTPKQLEVLVTKAREMDLSEDQITQLLDLSGVRTFAEILEMMKEMGGADDSEGGIVTEEDGATEPISDAAIETDDESDEEDKEGVTRYEPISVKGFDENKLFDTIVDKIDDNSLLELQKKIRDIDVQFGLRTKDGDRTRKKNHRADKQVNQVMMDSGVYTSLMEELAPILKPLFSGHVSKYVREVPRDWAASYEKGAGSKSPLQIFHDEMVQEYFPEAIVDFLRQLLRTVDLNMPIEQLKRVIVDKAQNVMGREAKYIQTRGLKRVGDAMSDKIFRDLNDYARIGGDNKVRELLNTHLSSGDISEADEKYLHDKLKEYRMYYSQPNNMRDLDKSVKSFLESIGEEDFSEKMVEKPFSWGNIFDEAEMQWASRMENLQLKSPDGQPLTTADSLRSLVEQRFIDSYDKYLKGVVGINGGISELKQKGMDNIDSELLKAKQFIIDGKNLKNEAFIVDSDVMMKYLDENRDKALTGGGSGQTLSLDAPMRGDVESEREGTLMQRVQQDSPETFVAGGKPLARPEEEYEKSEREKALADKLMTVQKGIEASESTLMAELQSLENQYLQLKTQQTGETLPDTGQNIINNAKATFVRFIQQKSVNDFINDFLQHDMDPSMIHYKFKPGKKPSRGGEEVTVGRGRPIPAIVVTEEMFESELKQRGLMNPQLPVEYINSVYKLGQERLNRIKRDAIVTMVGQLGLDVSGYSVTEEEKRQMGASASYYSFIKRVGKDLHNHLLKHGGSEVDKLCRIVRFYSTFGFTKIS